jgi:hypothetical protein
MIPPKLRILDVGCGAMEVEKYLSPELYKPIDKAARDARTEVLDLNESEIPPKLLEAVDVVIALGTLEYLKNIGPLLRSVAASGKPLLCSYPVSELTPDVDRASNGWVNSFDSKAFEKVAREFGLVPVKRVVCEKTEAIYLFQAVNSEGIARQVPWEVAADPSQSAKKRSIMILGFYGRGNCGDEALLQSVYETFKDEYDITISVDETGAYPGWWNWYPYSACHRVHQTNIAEFQRRDYAAVIVGGGGLKIGFGATQITAAKARGIPTLLTGVDFPLDRGLDYDAAGVRCGLNMFDLISVRTKAGKELFDKHGFSASLSADWAWRLPTDTATEVSADPQRAVVVVREFPIETVDQEYFRSVQTVIAGLRAQGFKPCLAPFCPEDERFARQTAIEPLAPTERQWWNPRRMKQLLVTSGLVVSIGRLHPIIFAADSDVKIAVLKPAISRGIERVTIGKIETFAAELEIGIFENAPALVDALRAGKIGPARRESVADAKSRLEAAVLGIKQFLHARANSDSTGAVAIDRLLRIG